MKNFTKLLLILLLNIFINQNAQAAQRITAYFFWGDGCPHCTKEKEFLSKLKKQYPTLNLKEFEIYKNTSNASFFRKAVDKFEITNAGVPLLIIGDKYFIGTSNSTVQNKIKKRINECMNRKCSDPLEKIFQNNLTQHQNNKTPSY